jgi:hypothetical protein
VKPGTNGVSVMSGGTERARVNNAALDIGPQALRFGASINSVDVAFLREAANLIAIIKQFSGGDYADMALRNLRAASGANGQYTGVKVLTELLTIAASATSTTAIQIPANAIVLAVSVRVTVAVTCTSTFTVGDGGNATRYSTAAVSKAATSTDVGTAGFSYRPGSATAVVITPDSTPSDATGRVRVTISYIEVTPPTS